MTDSRQNRTDRTDRIDRIVCVTIALAILSLATWRVYVLACRETYEYWHPVVQSFSSGRPPFDPLGGLLSGLLLSVWPALVLPLNRPEAPRYLRVRERLDFGAVFTVAFFFAGAGVDYLGAREATARIASATAKQLEAFGGMLDGAAVEALKSAVLELADGHGLSVMFVLATALASAALVVIAWRKNGPTTSDG